MSAKVTIWKFHDPIVIGDQMQRCLEGLKISHFADLPDLKLVAWVELQRIAEEAGAAFDRDSEAFVSLGDSDVCLRIEQHCNKYHTWWNETDARIMDGKHDACPQRTMIDLVRRIPHYCVSLQQSQGF
jgi:hypothetical protein